MNNWINVNDRLPKDSQDCILFYTDIVGVGYRLNDKWYSYGSDGLLYAITHWQPLPEAPNKEVEQKCTLMC